MAAVNDAVYARLSYGGSAMKNIKAAICRLNTRCPSRKSGTVRFPPSQRDLPVIPRYPPAPSTSTMFQVLSTATSSTDFGTIFGAALEAYKKQTKKDVTSIPSHPAAAFDQSQSADEKLTKWLDPTVNVLYAFSATLGEGVGLAFPPAKTISLGLVSFSRRLRTFAPAKMLLWICLGRMEYFLKRLERYIDVRPTAAMTDIIVKIMVELISILGMVTKEIRAGTNKLPLDVKENGVAIQQVVNQVSDLNRNELRMKLRSGSLPPDPSVNYNTASDAHHEGTAVWCTKGNTLADWKTSGSLIWIHGKRTYPIII
ncbi:hypothetical protein EDB84DRAFT_1578716 [Lactarius hengduanensis]|nr:hypothetical protein EDB84DRAFT_1578716 [Lactarius hengduanensis]